MRPKVLFWIVLTLSAISAASGATTRRLILQVEQAPAAWTDGHLTEQLVAAFSRNPNLRIVTPDNEGDDHPSFPEDHYNVDSLVDWGTEIGGRYLLVVTVFREELKRRKKFSLPLIFQRWETVGILEGELRLLDLQKRRLLIAEPFSIKKSGSKQIQAEWDNNKNDPSLHLNAMAKDNLFRALELKLVDRLVKDFDHYTRGR